MMVSRPGCLAAVVLAGACVGGCPRSKEAPRAAATPAFEVFLTPADPSSTPEPLTPAEQAEMAGINRGIASLKKRFTAKQRVEMRLAYRDMLKKQLDAMIAADKPGKFLDEVERPTPEGDARAKKIYDSHFGAFQKKYKLSDEEMSAMSSVGMPGQE
ncbi:MAG: hypothetical protein QM758_05310 [Armatimonas sp.]